MAIKLDAIKGRGDLYQVDPRAIQIEQGFNPRSQLGDIGELAMDIDANGVRVPLMVRKTESGEIILVAGHRRLAAVSRLIEMGREIKSIPCIFTTAKMSETERFLLALSENNRENLSVTDQARAFKRLQTWGFSIQEISTKTGASVSTITSRLALIERATPLVLTALESGDINQTMALEIAKSADTVEGQQAALAEKTAALPTRLQDAPKEAEQAQDKQKPQVATVKRLRRANGSVEKSQSKKARGDYDGMVCAGDIRDLVKQLENTNSHTVGGNQRLFGVYTALKFVLGDAAVTDLRIG